MNQRWSVGALARATGLTVRTLHHYDELGLLRPSERTAAGHRRYTEDDLRRLYRVRVLRQLGLSLEEIGAALARPEELAELLRRRRERLDDEIWRLGVLLRQVDGLLEQVEPDSSELLARLGTTSMFYDQLDRRQHEVLHESAEALGPDGREELDREWPAVLRRFAEHCRADTPVQDPEVRETVGRLVEIVNRYAGGDAELTGLVGRYFRSHGVGVVRDYIPDIADLGDRLFAYVSRAYSHS
ncbi:MerR family transcriptional regulator [Actinokineospora guangxiensis]|uniref:MerR family transcriptional regulator n=1 Tax=Actinokineospora guangxiensis TaxID=1490288 RepID=A0ABW0EPI9_9PSEU